MLDGEIGILGEDSPAQPEVGERLAPTLVETIERAQSAVSANLVEERVDRVFVRAKLRQWHWRDVRVTDLELRPVEAHGLAERPAVIGR